MSSFTRIQKEFTSREGVECPDRLVVEAVPQSAGPGPETPLVQARRLRSLLPDGSRLKRLRDGWLGSLRYGWLYGCCTVLGGGEERCL